MSELRVSLVQVHLRPGAPRENLAAACALVDQASAAGAELILLPEGFSVGPYPLLPGGAPAPAAEGMTGPTVSALRAKAQERRVAIAAPFCEQAGPGLPFNTILLLGPEGETIGSYRQTHLVATPGPGKGGFQPGSAFTLLPYKAWRIGFLFGSEVLHPEAGRALSILGAELLLVAAACPPRPLWAELASTRAFENGCYVGVCSLAGALREGGPPLAGSSLLVEPLGNVLARLPAEGDGLLTETIRMGEVHRARNQRFMLRDRRPDVYGPLARAGAAAGVPA